MKYIILCKLPSGTIWALSHHERKVALVAVCHGAVRNASAFDTAEEAEAYLDEQLRVAPDLEKFGPFTIQPMELPQ